MENFEVGRVVVEFELLNDLTLPPVVKVTVSCRWKAVGVPGRANSPPCPFSCYKKSPVCAFLPFGCLPRRQGGEGRVGRVVFFSVLSSFQNSSSSHEATLGHAMCFLRNSHKQTLESPVLPFRLSQSTRSGSCTGG